MKLTSFRTMQVLKTCLAVAMSTLLLGVVSSIAKADDPLADGPLKQGQGLLETSTGIYEFTPKTCAIYEEDGVFDIEIQGRARLRTVRCSILIFPLPAMRWVLPLA